MTVACTAVVLAGGQGTRMGRLGRFLPKAALVTYDRSLLARHLDHLLEAGFQQVIVSTNSTHYPQILNLVTTYQAENPAQIAVLDNPAHFTGPIEALEVALRQVETPRCLMVLSDEFLRANSFPAFAALVDDQDDYLAVAPVVDERELKRGGYIRVENGLVRGVVERAEPEPLNAFPSPGTALFTRQPVLEAIRSFLRETPPGAAVGDFYNFHCRRGHVYRALMGPDFININSPDQLLLATLYASMEAHARQPALHAHFARAALELRASLAAALR